MFSQWHRCSERGKCSNGKVRGKPSLLLKMKWWIVFVSLCWLEKQVPNQTLHTDSKTFCSVLHRKRHGERVLAMKLCYDTCHHWNKRRKCSDGKFRREPSHVQKLDRVPIFNWFYCLKSKHQGCKRSKCKRRALLYPTSWALLRLFLDMIFHNKRQTCSHGKFREKQSLLQ